MSKQANGAYPLKVICEKGDLIEHDPATNEPVRPPSSGNFADSTYTEVGSNKSCMLNLKQFNAAGFVIYEMEYTGDSSDWGNPNRAPEETQRRREKEQLSAKGKFVGEDTFSFFGSPRTTSELEVWIEMATPKSIEKYLGSAQSSVSFAKRKKNATVDRIETEMDALRKRLRHRDIGYFEFWACKETSGEYPDDPLESKEAFGVTFFLLPTDYETIKKACVAGKRVTATIQIERLPGFFYPTNYCSSRTILPEYGPAPYKILHSVDDVQEVPSQKRAFLRGLADGVPATGFEFSFSFSEHEGQKDHGEAKAEVAKPQEPQLPKPDDGADKTEPWRWDADDGVWRSGPDRQSVREGWGDRRKPFIGVVIMIVLLIAIFVSADPLIIAVLTAFLIASYIADNMISGIVSGILSATVYAYGSDVTLATLVGVAVATPMGSIVKAWVPPGRRPRSQF